jgi:hypothetical protein
VQNVEIKGFYGNCGRYAALATLRCTISRLQLSQIRLKHRLRTNCGISMSNNTKKPEADYSFKHEEDRPAKRKCLNCSTNFTSEGWGNRLCQTCRSRSSSSMAA